VPKRGGMVYSNFCSFSSMTAFKGTAGVFVKKQMFNLFFLSSKVLQQKINGKHVIPSINSI
jgi:hypothetical protein